MPVAAEYAYSRLREEPSLLPLVKQWFREVIEPVYGDQGKALRKIVDGIDRECEILMEGERAVGILVYKTKLVQEYIDLGIEEAFEIKTLALLAPQRDGGRGLGERLIERCIELAQAMGARWICGTVAKTLPRIMHFFLRHGFAEVGLRSGLHLLRRRPGSPRS